MIVRIELLKKGHGSSTMFGTYGPGDLSNSLYLLIRHGVVLTAGEEHMAHRKTILSALDTAFFPRATNPYDEQKYNKCRKHKLNESLKI